MRAGAFHQARSPHKNGLRIKLTVFRVDIGVSEPTIVQGAVGPDHGPGTHHRNGNGVFPLPAHDGKEEETVNMETWRVRAVPVEMRQNINIQVGQI
ncbi:MAG: hypothetical protein NVSMB58_36670 [Terriglobales bacterium]